MDYRVVSFYLWADSKLFQMQFFIQQCSNWQLPQLYFGLEVEMPQVLYLLSLIDCTGYSYHDM